MDVRAWIYAGLRTGAQALWALVVAFLAKKGVVVPEALHGWFVDVLVLSTAVGLGTAGIRWLETRNGDSAGARLARAVAKILMLGLSARQPAYAAPDTRAVSASVQYANGSTVPTLRE